MTERNKLIESLPEDVAAQLLKFVNSYRKTKTRPYVGDSNSPYGIQMEILPFIVLNEADNLSLGFNRFARVNGSVYELIGNPYSERVTAPSFSVEYNVLKTEFSGPEEPQNGFPKIAWHPNGCFLVLTDIPFEAGDTVVLSYNVIWPAERVTPIPMHGKELIDSPGALKEYFPQQ